MIGLYAPTQMRRRHLRILSLRNMPVSYTNLLSYIDFIKNHPTFTQDIRFINNLNSTIDDIDVLQLVTMRYIKEHYPKKYHRSQEWEYTIDATQKSVTNLSVWKTEHRTDKPMMVQLSNVDSTAMWSIVTNLVTTD